MKRGDDYRVKVEVTDKLKNNTKNKNAVSKPRVFAEGFGEKDIYFQTVLENAKENYIGIKIMSEDGKTCNKTIDSANGSNEIALALDALTNMKIPVGTRFSVKIRFDSSDAVEE